MHFVGEAVDPEVTDDHDGACLHFEARLHLGARLHLCWRHSGLAWGTAHGDPNLAAKHKGSSAMPTTHEGRGEHYPAQ